MQKEAKKTKKQVKQNRKIFGLAFDSVEVVLMATLLDILEKKNEFKDISPQSEVVALLTLMMIMVRLGMYEKIVDQLPESVATMMNTLFDASQKR